MTVDVCLVTRGGVFLQRLACVCFIIPYSSATRWGLVASRINRKAHLQPGTEVSCHADLSWHAVPSTTSLHAQEEGHRQAGMQGMTARWAMSPSDAC